MDMLAQPIHTIQWTTAEINEHLFEIDPFLKTLSERV